jgi:hypothetical protein
VSKGLSGVPGQGFELMVGWSDYSSWGKVTDDGLGLQTDKDLFN